MKGKALVIGGEGAVRQDGQTTGGEEQGTRRESAYRTEPKLVVRGEHSSHGA